MATFSRLQEAAGILTRGLQAPWKGSALKNDLLDHKRNGFKGGVASLMQGTVQEPSVRVDKAARQAFVWGSVSVGRLRGAGRRVTGSPRDK